MHTVMFQIQFKIKTSLFSMNILNVCVWKTWLQFQSLMYVCWGAEWVRGALQLSATWLVYKPIWGSIERRRRHCSRMARSVFPTEWPTITVWPMSMIAWSIVSGVTAAVMMIIPTIYTHTHRHTHTHTHTHRHVDMWTHRYVVNFLIRS